MYSLTYRVSVNSFENMNRTNKPNALSNIFADSVTHINVGYYLSKTLLSV